MIQLISLGFVAIFLLAFWASARVGMKRQSASLGLFAGLISFLVMICFYSVGLMLWARAAFTTFVETRVPALVEKAMMLVDRAIIIRDSI